MIHFEKTSDGIKVTSEFFKETDFSNIVFVLTDYTKDDILNYLNSEKDRIIKHHKRLAITFMGEDVADNLNKYLRKTVKDYIYCEFPELRL